MITVDLYIRVSTDEQAEKGYSQRNQEEILRKYCGINSFQIRKIIFEDHSAKTFNRPRWNELLADLRRTKGKTQLLLFTKWDRFSRNAGDAYQMINILRKLSIEPQAIEQPLDLSIPENKMMLAFYLAAPEVENDRRALNVFFGMRRAKKEGRWMSTAPIGYINKTDESGRKYIAPKEPQASIMRWAFQEIANGQFASDPIRKEVNKKGIKCSKSNFWNAIRNPVYCGKIQILQFKDEELDIVQGKHEPLISEALFYEVQEILSGRKRSSRHLTKMSSDKKMPLRGFLICPKCNRMLTGSASKGKYKHYYYYHCISPCGCRFKSDNANDLFLKELKKFVPKPGIKDLIIYTLKEAFYEKVKNKKGDRNDILSQIEVLNTRLKNAREMVADQKLDPEDFKELKLDCTNKISILESKLSSFSNKENSIEGLLKDAVNNLCNLNTLFENGTVIQQRQIISSIYPEKLIFDGFQYRTPRLNEAVKLIYGLGTGLIEMKNRKDGENLRLSGMVVPTGIEPVSKV